MTKRTAALLAAAVAAAGPASAQVVQNIVLRNSFNPVGAGARGLGMGGAFIAVADDGTAASFNPAGLSQLRRTEIAVVGFDDELVSDLSVPRLGTQVREVQRSRSRHRAADFVGLAVPFEVARRSLTVQLSYQRAVDLFGRGTAVTRDILGVQELADYLGVDPRELALGGVRSANLANDIEPSQSGAFHTVSVAAGYQVTRRFSLGASVNYWLAEWTAQGRSVTSLSIAVPPNPSVPIEVFRSTTDFVQDQSLRGLNLNAGFLLRYPRLSIGGVLRLPFSGAYDLQESAQEREFFRGEGEFELAPVYYGLTTRLQWPRSAGVGVALRPFRGLTLAADYSKASWSRTSIEDVPEGALLSPPPLDADGNPRSPLFLNLNFFDLQAASQTTTIDTSQWRAGLEYLVSLPKVIVPLRGGVFRDRSPVAQLGAERGREIKGFTAGTGLNFSRLVLDVAFERRESEGVVGLIRRGGEALPSASAPSESVREDRIVASLIYRAGGEDDPLKRALRFLFVGPKEDEGN